MSVEFKTKYAALKNIVAVSVGATAATITYFLMLLHLPTFWVFMFVFTITFLIGLTLGMILYFLIPHSLKTKIWTPFLCGSSLGFISSLIISQTFVLFNLIGAGLGIIAATSAWLTWMKLRHEKIKIFRK